MHRSASILATANGGEKCGFLINHGVENLQSPSFDDASEAKVSKVRGHPLSRHVTTKTAVSSFFFSQARYHVQKVQLALGHGRVKP